jgi:hypothetical protein
MSIQFTPTSSPLGFAGNAVTNDGDKNAPAGVDRSAVGSIPAQAPPDVIAQVAGAGDTDSIHHLFSTGGQVPLEAPTEPADQAAARTLSAKCHKLLQSMQTDDSAGSGSSNGTNGVSDIGAARNNSGVAGLGMDNSMDFDIDAILHLLVAESSTEYRQAAQASQQDLLQKVKDLEASESDMKSEAQKKFGGQLALGIGQMVAGTLTVVGSGVSARGAISADSRLNLTSGLDPQQNATQFQRLTSSSSAMAGALQGTGTATQGAMGVVQGTQDKSASYEEADKEEADKAATSEDAAHEAAQNLKQQYQAVIQDFLDKEKSLEQTQNETTMGIAQKA